MQSKCNRHFQMYLIKKGCIVITDFGESVNLAWNKFFHLYPWKITMGRKHFNGTLEKFQPRFEMDLLRPDGRDEWYISHRLSFRATHFTPTATIIYPDYFPWKYLREKRADGFRKKLRKNVVAPTDLRHKRAPRLKKFPKPQFYVSIPFSRAI